MKQKIDSVNGDLDRLCRAVKQLTVANAARIMDDPANVTFQPPVVSLQVWRLLSDILSFPPTLELIPDSPLVFVPTATSS